MARPEPQRSPRDSAVSREWTRAAIQRGVFFLLLLGTWQVLSMTHAWNPVLFPAPSAVVLSLWRGMADGTYIAASWASLGRLALGYLISVVLGIPLGLLLGRIRWMDRTVGAAALGLQALPSICWLPLAILWFGLGGRGILFVVVMGSLMAFALTVRDGVRAIPPLYLKAARMLGANPHQTYLHVVLPASLPAVLTGARMAWTFAWRSLMAAELLTIDTGLGSLLSSGRELHDMPRVVSVMLIIMALGLLAERLLFTALERRIQVRWGHYSSTSAWGV